MGGKVWFGPSDFSPAISSPRESRELKQNKIRNWNWDDANWFSTKLLEIPPFWALNFHHHQKFPQSSRPSQLWLSEQKFLNF